MLDEDKDKDKKSIPVVSIFIVGLLIFAAVSLIMSVSTSVEKNNDFVEEVEAMNCGELLSEIKDKHRMTEGYAYIDTWIEKECWK